MAREHEKSSRNQVLTSPGSDWEPGTGNDASTLGPDVVAALSLLSEMINEGSKLWPPSHCSASPCKADESVWSAVLMPPSMERRGVSTS